MINTPEPQETQPDLPFDMQQVDLPQLLVDLDHFREVRGWKPYNNPKDLAISICLEAGELLENFQWIPATEAIAKRRTEISEELADVLIYSLTLMVELGLDFESIIREKIAKNALKYPALEQ